MKIARIVALGATAVFSLSGLAGAQTPDMAQVLRVTREQVNFAGVSISPDGTHIAFVKSQNRKGTLEIEDLASKRASTVDVKDAYAPVWSPDGSHIAVLAGKEKPALEVINADGSGARVVSALGGAPQNVQWSPDGTRLALLYIEHPHRAAGALAAGARDVGVIGSVTDEQQLAVVDVHSGAISLVTPADDYVYEYSWSPDSARFAFTYAKGNGDNNWWVAKLATVDANGRAMRDVLVPKFQINAPTWAPDGSSIAVIGGIMSDFGSVGGDVYVVPAAGGEPRDVTPGAHYNAAAIAWPAPDHMMVTAHVSGALHLLDLTVSNGSTKTLIGGEDVLRGISYARRAPQIALVRSSFERAPEIWAGTPSDLHQITNDNADIPKLYGTAKSLTWKSDEFTAQGWLIAPQHVEPGRKYPMVVIIHGGPSAESLPSYDSSFVAALSISGFYVFEPNPRGSYGQGEAFTRANVKDFGYGDWRDDLAGVDAAIAAAPIDPNRLGLFGWSYGGYMGMWAETQTTRFKAIVAGAGVVNWQSYYGQNKIDQWMIPFFGASVYDDPAVYAKSSPITFIKNSHTPVLILQGERDEEVPAPQAFEFYHAMQDLGVPSQLVVYADEGHGPRQPKNQIDIFTRTAGWFNKYLK